MDDPSVRALYEDCYARLVGQVYPATGDFAAAQDAVAEATGAPVGTVKARLVRGRARIAILLSERDDIDELDEALGAGHG